MHKSYVTLDDYTYLIMPSKHYCSLFADPNTFVYVIKMKIVSEGFKLKYI